MIMIGLQPNATYTSSNPILLDPDDPFAFDRETWDKIARVTRSLQCTGPPLTATNSLLFIFFTLKAEQQWRAT